MIIFCYGKWGNLIKTIGHFYKNFYKINNDSTISTNFWLFKYSSLRNIKLHMCYEIIHFIQNWKTVYKKLIRFQ